MSKSKFKYIAGLSGKWCAIDSIDMEMKMFYLCESADPRSLVTHVLINDEGFPVCAVDDSDLDGWEMKEWVVGNMETSLIPFKETTMPDETTSFYEMHQYGYTWTCMLPLNKEKAHELMEKGKYSIYALYPDNTESEVLTEEEFNKHIERDGLFGITKEDWIIELWEEGQLV